MTCLVLHRCRVGTFLEELIALCRPHPCDEGRERRVGEFARSEAAAFSITHQPLVFFDDEARNDEVVQVAMVGTMFVHALLHDLNGVMLHANQEVMYLVVVSREQVERLSCRLDCDERLRRSSLAPRKILELLRFLRQQQLPVLLDSYELGLQGCYIAVLEHVVRAHWRAQHHPARVR